MAASIVGVGQTSGAGAAGSATGGDISSLEERVTELAIKHLREMSADQHRRLAQFEDYFSQANYPASLEVMQGGVLYAPDRYLKLKKLSRVYLPAEQELEELKKVDAFFHVHAPLNFMSPFFVSWGFPNGLQVKPDIYPADAARACKRGPSHLLCNEAILFAWCLALLDELGDEKFNAIFGHHAKTPFSLEATTGTCLRKLINVRIIEEGEEGEEITLRRGEFVGFQNISQYSKWHPAELGDNMNCLVTTPGKIGKGVNQEPEVTYLGCSGGPAEKLQALKESLFNSCLDTTRKVDYEMFSKKLLERMRRREIVTEPFPITTFEEWEKEGGGKHAPFVYSLDRKSMHQLKAAGTVEKALEIYLSFPNFPIDSYPVIQTSSAFSSDNL